MKALGNEGLHKLLAAHEDKTAYAQCALSFCIAPGVQPVTFLGRCEGEITDPVGIEGFGWDAVFKPHGSDVTFASMSKESKNKISHRSRALEQFSSYLEEAGEALLLQHKQSVNSSAAAVVAHDGVTAKQ
jgi:inosine triphosphate pyrophosphatase